jgi:hypothetical protein
MKRNAAILFGALSLSALLSAAVSSPAEGARTSIGFGAGYFFPFGDWKTHRYGGFDQFGGGVTFQADTEIRFTQHLGMALNAGYINLGTGAWEDHAASGGDVLNASAYIFYAGVQFKPHLWEDRLHTFALLLGLNYCLSSGRETFQGTTYDYDFMKNKLGYLIGAEFARDISRNTALTISVSALIIPGGVEYADGLSYTITGVPLTAGLRYRF